MFFSFNMCRLLAFYPISKKITYLFCYFILLKDSFFSISIDKDEKEEILEIANNFSQLEIGERLKIAQDLAKDKKEALLFLEKLIIVTRNKMVNNQEVSLAKNLKILQKYYREIKQSNVNFRLGLENLFLEM